MRRRDFLKGGVVGAAALAAGAPGARGYTQAVPRPNILVLLTDDQDFRAVHALGNPEIETPNLDRLVSRGTAFTHAYTMGGYHGAVCVASRTMLMTGRSIWRARALDSRERLSEERGAGRLWPQLMRAAGYETYMAGKWHVQIDPMDLFDHVATVRPGMPNVTPENVPEAYDRPVDGVPDPWRPWDPRLGGYWEGGRHWSEVLADEAADFLNQARARNKPFFMYLAFNAPHDPRQAPRACLEQYALDQISVPENFLPEYPYNEEIGIGRELRDERLAPFPRTEHAVRTHRREYYAIVTHLDTQIGRILDVLEATGQASNTAIVFTSDQGLAAGQHGFMGKQNMYDHSLRVPLVLAGPGIELGRRVSAPVYAHGIGAACLELAGAELPPHVEFRSPLEHLRGGTAQGPGAIYAAYMDLQRMVAAGGFKLIWYPAAGVVQLFNLDRDPWETRDLADAPEFAAVKAGLIAQLAELQAELGDPGPMASEIRAGEAAG